MVPRTDRIQFWSYSGYYLCIDLDIRDKCELVASQAAPCYPWRMLKTYPGSCHCGAVRFEADLDLSQPTYRCNCSICRRTRFWAAVARPEGFRLLEGKGELTKYLFNSRKNEHYFCRRCGVRAFGVGTDTPIGVMVGVNVGCLQDVTESELAAIPVVRIDGMHDRMETPEFTAHL